MKNQPQLNKAYVNEMYVLTKGEVNFGRDWISEAHE